MKILITVAFIAAAIAAICSYAGLISSTSMVPPVLFAVALILVLLSLMQTGDHRY